MAKGHTEAFGFGLLEGMRAVDGAEHVLVEDAQDAGVFVCAFVDAPRHIGYIGGGEAGIRICLSQLFLPRLL